MSVFGLMEAHSSNLSSMNALLRTELANSTTWVGEDVGIFVTSSISFEWISLIVWVVLRIDWLRVEKVSSRSNSPMKIVIDGFWDWFGKMITHNEWVSIWRCQEEEENFSLKSTSIEVKIVNELDEKTCYESNGGGKWVWIDWMEETTF